MTMEHEGEAWTPERIRRRLSSIIAAIEIMPPRSNDRSSDLLSTIRDDLLEIRSSLGSVIKIKRERKNLCSRNA